ncbi:heavy metal translocating P-type ATPase [Neobittarella massiliensis]|uniref:heavy metal translocating P-type ATPase n=1 Tax=Neobittarella massiliensis (ex Bilen et al. 2018) TaxID=2041842 RepID=UPI000CF65A72|nr:heavy metal translocating P-type ATPase [Neobittarella massiliensis]
MKTRLSIQGLSCSHCAMKIEEKLEHSNKFDSIALLFATGVLLIENDHPVTDQELSYIQQVCDDIEPGTVISRAAGNTTAPDATPATHANGDSCGCGHEHHHKHGDSCGCGHEHHHEHGGSCGCGHEHHHEHGDSCGCDHEHHHEHGDSCGCDHEHHHEHGGSCGCGHEHTDEPAAPIDPKAFAGSQKLYFTGLSCSHCAMKIEEKLQQSGKFQRAAVSFASGTILIKNDHLLTDSEVAFIAQVYDDIEPGTHISRIPADTVTVSAESASPSARKSVSKAEKKRPFVLLIASVALAVAGLITSKLLDISWLPPVLFVLSCVLSSYDVWYRGITGIAKKRVDENLLVTIAIIASFFIGEFPEAAMVALLFKISLFLEDKAVGATRKNISAITNIQPDSAKVLLPDGSTRQLRAEEVQVGQTIVISPSERIPLDCTVLEGNTATDNSAITGESIPVNVGPGDKLLSGSINLTGLIKATVTSRVEESTAARIINLVEESAAQKSHSQKFITKFAAVYTPVIIGLAILVAIFPPLLGLGSWKQWIYTALVFVVSACPCALVISIPLGFFSGIGAATKRGVLIKGGKHIENLSKLTDAVFDKTGTLTDGQLKVTGITAFGDFTTDQVLRYSALAESFSAHPISRSIIAQCPDKPQEEIVSYQEVAGKGVLVQLKEHQLACGSLKLMADQDIRVPQGVEANVLLAVDGQLAGAITVGDALRPDSAQMVADLKAAGVQTVTMLTGDSQKAAAKISGELGLDRYYAELLPQDKVQRLTDIKGEGRMVAFVGDGINDAPVLAASDVGVAMGFGTEAAIEAADVVLVSGKPSSLVTAVKLSKRVMRIIQANIVFALAVKFLVIVLSLFSLSTIWMAVFADVGVTVLSVLNTTRLLLGKKST